MASPLKSLIACGTKLWLDSIDPDLVVPDWDKSIDTGALAPYVAVSTGETNEWAMGLFRGVAQRFVGVGLSLLRLGKHRDQHDRSPKQQHGAGETS